MTWGVEFHEDFEGEFDMLSEVVQKTVMVKVGMLEEFGPSLGRPNVDTLRGSRHGNMKELRFNADNGVWRMAFAFNHKQKAILLVAGDKMGVKERQFYDKLISVADRRFDEHLKIMEGKK